VLRESVGPLIEQVAGEPTAAVRRCSASSLPCAGASRRGTTAASSAAA